MRTLFSYATAAAPAHASPNCWVPPFLEPKSIMLEPKSIVATPSLTQPMQIITTPDLPASMPPYHSLVGRLLLTR